MTMPPIAEKLFNAMIVVLVVLLSLVFLYEWLIASRRKCQRWRELERLYYNTHRD